MHRKLLIGLICGQLVYALHVNAQVQTSFWKGWFLQLNLAENIFYGSQEKGYDFSKSPFKGFRNNPALSISVGKWFSPDIALRSKVNGIWGKTVISEDSKTNASKYFTLSEQVLLDVTNIICGYDCDRKWHIIPFFGGGLGRNMTYDSWATNLSFGILNEIKVSKHLLLNAELGYTLHTAEFDGKRVGGTSTHSLKNEDHQFAIEFGITYTLH